MMSVQSYIEHIRALKNDMGISLDIIQDYLKNKTEPLDERWNVYKTIVEENLFYEVKSYGDGFIDDIGGRDELTLYDSFYIERYETKSFIYMEKIVKEHDSWEYDLTQWKEKVLASGYSHFIFDW